MGDDELIPPHVTVRDLFAQMDRMNAGVLKLSVDDGSGKARTLLCVTGQPETDEVIAAFDRVVEGWQKLEGEGLT